MRRNMELRKMIKEGHELGMSIYGIAKLLGITHKRVSGYYKRMGLKAHHKSPRKKIDVDLVKKLANEGYTVSEIIEETGYNRSSLRRHIKNHNISIISSKQKRVNKIKQLYGTGISIESIGEEVGLSKHTVRRNLIELGIIEKVVRTSTYKEQIIERYNNGEDIKNIITNGEYSEHYAKQVLKDSGFLKFSYTHSIYMCSFCGGSKDASCKRCDKCIDKFGESLLSYLNKKFFLVKNEARKANRYFNIDRIYMLDLWNIQKGICAYTKNILDYETKKRGRFLPTLDRIDSNKGYIKGNVCWVCDKINAVKNDLSLVELKEYIPIIYNGIAIVKEKIKSIPYE